jgi:hypothetical protein
MSTFLPVGLARDAVAAQFSYSDEPAAAEPQTRRAPRTRSAMAGVLHRLGDLVAPAEQHPAH